MQLVLLQVFEAGITLGFLFSDDETEAWRLNKVIQCDGVRPGNNWYFHFCPSGSTFPPLTGSGLALVLLCFCPGGIYRKRISLSSSVSYNFQCAPSLLVFLNFHISRFSLYCYLCYNDFLFLLPTQPAAHPSTSGSDARFFKDFTYPTFLIPLLGSLASQHSQQFLCLPL